MTEQKKRDAADMLALAQEYMAFHRCRLCERLTVAGYICRWCDRDDTPPPEKAAVSHV